ncbi:MAG: hypothetical protein AAF489_02365 [Bacteroidota bacterium]
MKNIFLVLFTVVGFGLSVQAQGIADNAIGIRVGDSDGFGTEINYQRGLSENNRLEFGLGWNSGSDVDAYKLTGLFQWVFVLDGNFNWYVGAGGGIGQIDFGNDFPGDPDNETFLFAAGDIGIEYDFDIPLLVAIDFRPEIGFGDFRDDLDFDIALSLRYQF